MKKGIMRDNTRSNTNKAIFKGVSIFSLPNRTTLIIFRVTKTYTNI